MISPNVRILIHPHSSLASWLLTSSGQERAACTEADIDMTHMKSNYAALSLSVLPLLLQI